MDKRVSENAVSFVRGCHREDLGIWGLNTIIARVDTNDEIFKKILDDEEFKSAVEGYYLRKVYSRLRETSVPE